MVDRASTPARPPIWLDRGAPARCHAPVVSTLSSVPRGDEDTLWAVVATVGRKHRVAEIFRNRNAALQDRDWRVEQVRAYRDFLERARQPMPFYSVTPIRRADLPRKWAPLPALGFLRGEFI